MKRPKPGDPSYPLYKEELDFVLRSLADKANLVYDRLNRIPGVTCNKVQGAMYAYPRVEISTKAWDDCKVGGEEVVREWFWLVFETSVTTHLTQLNICSASCPFHSDN